MSRLSDGMTFKFDRFASDFSSVLDFATIEDEQVALRLLQVQGRVTVPPVFEGDVAVFYTSERISNDGNLHFYLYNTHMEQLELVFSDKVRDEISTEYQAYSLVKLGTADTEGILFKAPNQLEAYRYDISSFDLTSTAGLIKSGALTIADNSDFTATVDPNFLVLKQIPEDPFHYNLSKATPKIYGWFDGTNVYELTWSTSD